MTSFQIHALPAAVVASARTTASTTSTPTAVVVADGGEPVRCCLRDAAPGDELLLFNYEPLLPASPYREVGAVYVHAHDCSSAPSTDAYPADWRGRPQVLRAYDERGWIHEATTVHDGSDPEAALAAVLAAPGVVQVHSRNIAYGCYMFCVTPAIASRSTRRWSAR
jgi:hypothetical protein